MRPLHFLIPATKTSRPPGSSRFRHSNWPLQLLSSTFIITNSHLRDKFQVNPLLHSPEGRRRPLFLFFFLSSKNPYTCLSSQQSLIYCPALDKVWTSIIFLFATCDPPLASLPSFANRGRCAAPPACPPIVTTCPAHNELRLHIRYDGSLCCLFLQLFGRQTVFLTLLQIPRATSGPSSPSQSPSL